METVKTADNKDKKAERPNSNESIIGVFDKKELKIIKEAKEQAVKTQQIVKKNEDSN